MSKISKIMLLIIIIGFGVNSAKNHTDKQEINTSKKSINSSDKSTDSSKKDYNILVSSNKDNVLISLNKDTKAINVKALDYTKDVPASDKYLKVSDEDLKYLEEN